MKEGECKGEDFQPYDDRVECKAYDDSIFTQLTKYEQTLLKGCGVAKIDVATALQNIFINVNYFDSFVKKKEGLPFDLDVDYDKTFLKSPTIPKEDKFMIIPLKPKGDSNPIRVAWTSPPNQVGAFSHFLNLDQEKERVFDRVLLACKPPPSPPPPPPVMLKYQEVTIQKQEQNQLQLLIIVQELMNFVKDSLKQKKIMEQEKVYTEIITKIKDSKKKELEYEAAINAYNKNSAQAYLTYEEKVKLEVEIDTNQRRYTQMEAIIKSYKIGEVDDTGTPSLSLGKIDIPKILSSVKKQIQKKVRDSLQGAIDSVVKRMPFYPDPKEMDELKKKIVNDKVFLTTYTDQLENLKENLIIADANLPADYQKTSLQLFVEKSLGMSRVVSAEEKAKRATEKTNYKKACDDLKNMETTKEGETFTTIVPYIQTVKSRFIKTLVSEYKFTPEQGQITNFLIKLPNPREHDFDQFKDLWSNEKCEKSPYSLPPSGSETSASIILPTFQSFINLYYNHLNDTKVSLNTLLP